MHHIQTLAHSSSIWLKGLGIGVWVRAKTISVGGQGDTF